MLINFSCISVVIVEERVEGKSSKQVKQFQMLCDMMKGKDQK